MKRARFFSMLSVAVSGAALFALGFGAGCGGGPGTLEPAYEGCATDENWSTFDDYESTARIKSDAGQVPTWLMPSPGVTISASAPPVFAWQPSATSTGMQDGDATCPQYQPASLHVLGSGVQGGVQGGLRPLHMPPVSGTVYDLHFAANGSELYRVLTTRQRVGVAANVWSSWSGKSVTVTLYSAKMLRNEVVDGPYVAQPLNVQITP